MPSLNADNVNCRHILSDREIVPDNQIKLFCEILQFRYEFGERHDTEDGRQIYTNRLRTLIPKLKFPLANRPGLIGKLILPKQSDYTYLCSMHKGLNADFVHQWFKYLALEVGARLELLRGYHPEYIGKHIIETVIKPLIRLQHMWETKERMEKAYGDYICGIKDRVENLIPVEQQKDGCEACTLARIGSHTATLLSLRAVVKSRITEASAYRHPSRLRLLRLIEPWLQILHDRIDPRSSQFKKWPERMQENFRLAMEMYAKRKGTELMLHEIKYLGGDIPQQDSDPETNNDNDDDDKQSEFYQAEHDMIDSYTALQAAQRQSQLLKSHPQYVRKTVSVSGEEHPQKAKNDTSTDTESIYSTDTVNNNRRVVSHSSRSSILSPHRAHSTKHTKRTDSVQTSWGEVIRGGQRANPFTSPSRSLAVIPEKFSGALTSSRAASTHGGVRRATSVSSAATSDARIRSSHDFFNPDHTLMADDSVSVVSQMSRTTLRDRPIDSPISSMSSYSVASHCPLTHSIRDTHRDTRDHDNDYRQNQVPPKLQRRTSHRDSACSERTDVSVQEGSQMSTRPSRPFDQLSHFGEHQKLSKHGRRK